MDTCLSEERLHPLGVAQPPSAVLFKNSLQFRVRTFFDTVEDHVPISKETTGHSRLRSF